ncbi:ABC transporter permease [Erwinia sp. INIA-01]|uniref:ABC transporter permease n=1 Tax=Erwinia sp. INIA01 TaxID=2991500 RepID=UPI0022244077|nr:ABC transporter permease [Erwinia sp. INIA01]MCW1876967.1 ABC transporter permease [Erwinia sp. INIA01]
MAGINRRLWAFLRAFRHEILVAWRKPVVHWLGWCFPLLLFALIASDFSAGTLLDLPIVAVDRDHSEASRQLIRNLNAGSHGQVTVADGGLPAALERLRRAEDYSVLMIPPFFEADLLAGRQPRVTLYYNALFYGAGFYSTQDFSGVIAGLNSQYQPWLMAASGRSMPVLPNVTLDYDSLFNASGSYIYYQQFAACIHLVQLFTVTLTIWLLARARPLIYQSHFGMALLGKLFPFTLCYTALLMMEIALLVGIFGARVVGNPFYMLAVAFFYVMAAQSLGVMLFTFTGSAITAYSMMGIFVSLALTFSGIAMPELSMPWPAQLISNIEPLTHALYAMFDLFLRDVPGKPVLSVCALLMVYPLFSALLVRKRLYQRLLKPEAAQ